MPIRLPLPIGIYPKLGEEALPPGAATEAINCNFTKGGVFPIVSAATPDAMWEMDGSTLRVKAGVLATDIAGPAKPSAPQFGGVTPLCKPLEATPWLTIDSKAYYTWINPATGNRVTSYEDVAITNPTLVYTPTGFEVHCSVSGAEIPVDTASTALATTSIHGPLYQFIFTGGATGEGGPDQTISFPADAALGYANDVIPEFHLPLYLDSDDTKRQYGVLTCTGVSGSPFWDQDVEPQAAGIQVFEVEGGDVVFTFDCCYRPAETTHSLYVMSLKDADGKEGPYSDLSSEIRVPPGHKLALTIQAPTTGGTRLLYRAGVGTSDFRMLPEIPSTDTGTTWYDIGDPETQIGLPATGAFTDFGYGAGDAEIFLESSFVAPSGFVVAVVNASVSPAVAKNLVVASDYLRPHCFDEFNTCDMGTETGLVLARVGGGALLFSTGSGNIYSLSCGSPDQVANGAGLVSKNHPLLNKGSLFSHGDQVGWVTNDGVAMSGGGTPRIMTKEQYDPTAWGALEPAKLRARTVGSWVLLEPDGSGTSTTKLMLDLDSMQITTWTGTWATSIAAAPSYTTGTIELDEPVYLDFIRANFDATCTVDAWADGVAQTQKTLTYSATPASSDSGKYIATGWTAAARRWKFKFAQSGVVAGAGIHFPVTLFERRVLPAGQSTTWGDGDVLVWEDVWFKYADVDKPVAGILNMPNAANALLTFKTAAGVTVGTAQTVTSGAPFYLDGNGSTPRTWAEATTWRLALTETGGADLASPVAGLTLMSRRTEEAGDAIREVNPQGSVAPWRVKAYRFPATRYIKSVYVRHNKPNSGTVAMSVFLEDGATATALVAPGGSSDALAAIAGGGVEILLAPQLVSLMEFHFGADDQYVQDVIVRTSAIETAGPGGMSVSGTDSWVGNLVKFESPVAPAWASVTALSYPAAPNAIALSLYGDGTPYDLVADDPDSLQALAFTSGVPKLLPRGLAQAAVWQSNLANAGTVEALRIVPYTVRSVGEGDITFTAPKGTAPPWWGQICEPHGSKEYVSLIVKADSYPVTINLYKDRAATATLSIPIASAGEVILNDPNTPFAPLGLCSSLEFDFGGTDDFKVRDVAIFVRDQTPVGAGRVERVGRLNWKRLYYDYSDKGRVPCLAAVGSSGYASCTLGIKQDDAAVDLNGVTAGTALAITSARPVYLPRGLATGSTMEVTISNTAETRSLHLWPRRPVAVPGGVIHLVGRPGEIQPWADAEFTFEGIQDVTSGIAFFTGTNAITVYKDRADTATVSAQAITSGVEFTLAGLTSCGSVDFRFTDDSAVSEVWLFTRKVDKIGPYGLLVRQAEGQQNYLGRAIAFKESGSFVAASIRGTSYSGMSLTLTPSSGTGTGSVSVANGGDFRLTTSAPATALPCVRDWTFSIVHAGRIEEVRLYGRVEFVVRDGVVRVYPKDEPWTWIARRVISAEAPFRPACVRVLSTIYPVSLTVYAGGYPATGVAVSVTSARFQWLPRWLANRIWEFDAVAPAGGQIQEVALATHPEKLG